MKIIKINDQDYELIKDYKEGFNEEDFNTKITDYFYPYDYIVGDISYGKLRLKGFYDDSNKEAKELNNIKNLDKYIADFCAPCCKYYILKKCIK